MSILKKPYEISVWEDEWNGTRFVEKKLEIIGSDTMQFQGRAIQPNLTKNVNGVKKFSFKMYHKFVDATTGEKVDNPFVNQLFSERKIKLKYDGEWYDFIIKNVVENSKDYLYTYQLEDALVQELSKNGFGVVLDEKIIDANGNSNIGTANQLASRVLEDTDWSVDDSSEAFVQTVDEALVYLRLPDNLDGLDIKHIKDQTDDRLNEGVTIDTVEENQKDLMGGKTVLGFYSSCTNKPHRFQFIYISDLVDLERDENRYIKNNDCQYYIDYDNPDDNPDDNLDSDYVEFTGSLNLFLPKGFSTISVDEDGYGYGVTLSSKYRGRRYGFSQQSKYIPVLDRYVNLYTDSDGESIYGYQHVEYKSPAFTQNMISNSSFDSTSGWTGTYIGEGTNKATVENVYGRFVGAEFVDSIDDLQDGSFESNIDNYKAYLKITFPDDKARVINSGPYDNRILIGNINPNEKWALRFSCAGQNELNGSNFSLGEYKYDSTSGGYESVSDSKIYFNSFRGEGNYYITQAISSGYSNEDFKQMNLRLCIAPPAGVEDAVYYLEKIELFEATYNGKILITPEEQGEAVGDRVIDKTYYYFYSSSVANITSADELVPDYVSKTLTYKTYKPVYNEGAQKVRSVTIKESNYFNILQSIAETFEAWLVLNISRDSITGAIDKKTVCFKNYIGENNYAGFRYGVNLKDIQRTYESKNIVTKLIVKQNSNKYAENGFCTIARAGANPTGENYIYDFQYFFNTGLLDARDYFETTYVQDGALGPDVGGKGLNLNGYFPRIKGLNNLIEEKNEILSNTAKDLTQYKAKLKVAEAGEEAAISGAEQAEEDFLSLTGFTIQEVFGGTTITNIFLDDEKKGSNEEAKEDQGYYYRQPSWLQGDLTIQFNEEDKSISIAGTAKEPLSSSETIYVDVYPNLFLSNGTEKVVHYSIECVFEEGSSTGSGNLELYLADTENTQVKKLYKEYSSFRIKENNYKIDKESQQNNVNTTQAIYNDLKEEINGYLDLKKALNKLFFSQYSRFIQEGTWINEEYVDDEKYYADAQSVMYNSCYPQVAYSINVLELSKLPGYETFSFKLGDKTYVEDPEFFGEGKREEVIITELSENLDDPSKNQIRVQNFKNQFQDLFQKITATVQQTQYSTGSYEKAVALAEANQARKQQFLTDALDSASARLSAAGQQSVTWGNDGITVKSVNSPCDAIRMVGGAILLSKQDKNGEQKWVTGVTSDGVSANLITAGTINVNDIKIMNSDEPVFKWDTFGISAYDAVWYQDDASVGKVVSNIDTKKFVRYDKYGIYGINNAGVDGEHWSPETQNDIDEKATFALTWDGLKVIGTHGGVARIGKQNGYILRVSNQEGKDTLRIAENGSVEIAGTLAIGGALGDASEIATKNDLNETKEFLEQQLDEIQEGLEEQLDGQISTYFLPYLPSKVKYPVQDSEEGANDGWGEDYEKHDGDLFYITSPGGKIYVYPNQPSKAEVDAYFIDKEGTVKVGVQNQAGNNVWKEVEDTDIINAVKSIGKCYRWNFSNNLDNSEWILVTDPQTIESLENAAKAQSTADGKMTVFGNPEDTTGVQDGDLLIPTEDKEVGEKTYKEGRVYKWVEESWSEISYTGSDVSNNFSWKFSPTEGMFMWNGAQGTISNTNPTGGAVFAIYSDPKETDNTKKHKLQMKGIIEAEGGHIAGWTIDSNGLKKGTLKDTSDYPFHMYTSFPEEPVTIAGQLANDWRLIIGDNFGVTQNGNVYAAGGNIGGWDINSYGLTKGYLGDTNKYPFHMYTSFPHGNTIIADHTANDWRLIIGDSFGVTKEGGVYATKGKIGGVEIQELVSPDFGRNFLVGGKDEQSSYDKTSQKEYLQTNFDLAPFFDARGLIEVTLSFDCKAAVAGEVLVYTQNGNGAKYSFNEYIDIKQANTYSRYSVTFTPTNSLATETRAMLAFYGTYNTGRTIAVKNLKLEIGAQATDWCPAIEETNVSSNTYSWKFSPTEGMFMWNGAQTGNPVFSVTDDGLYIDGKGSFTGTITADGGEIGGLLVEGNYASLGNIEFKEDIISLSGNDSKIELNGLILKNEDASTSVILGTQKLKISGAGGDQIVLDNSGKGNKTLTYKLQYSRVTVGNNGEKSQLRLTVTNLSTTLGYNNTITVYFTRYRPDANIEGNKYYKTSYSFTVGRSTKKGDTIEKDIYANFQDNAPILGGTDYVGFGLSQSDADASAETKSHSFKTAYTIGENYTYTEPNSSNRALFNCHLIPGGQSYDIGTGPDGNGNGAEPWRNIYAQNALITTSWCDARLKNSIESMDDRYDIFFDKMEPVRFKYNNGTSNRYHTGFIAQSLVKSLEESGLTTQEFAAVALDKMGTEHAFWYLRREEIVSLNTWQIQKLKPRMASAEEKLIAYETRISALEAEIKNLKSSQNSDII